VITFAVVFAVTLVLTYGKDTIFFNLASTNKLRYGKPEQRFEIGYKCGYCF
jgi:hypothetical protein